MQHLTVKDLACYLPHKLRIMVASTERDLTAVCLDSKFCYVTTYKGSRQKQMIDIRNIKPLLYPLSMLTQPIKHKGEEFVPIDKLSFYEWSVVEREEFMKAGTDNYPYSVIKKLHEWLFWTGDQSLFDKGVILDKSKM